MKKTPEFTNFLDAIKDILNGKPVDDLEEQIKACSFGKVIFSGTVESGRDFSDFCYACGHSLVENMVLMGEDPVDVYGTNDYREWQIKTQENLRQFLDKYKGE